MKKTAREAPAATLARQRARFMAFLAARTGSKEEAEELLQAAFVKGLKSAKGLKDEEKATAWFYRLLRNALTDHWRRRAAEGRALDEYGRERRRQAAISAAELDRRVCACVKALAGTIKPEYAEAVRRVDLEGASLKEFARDAGVSENSAAVRLHRARKTLKMKLVETCGACASHGCRDCDCGEV